MSDDFTMVFTHVPEVTFLEVHHRAWEFDYLMHMECKKKIGGSAGMKISFTDFAKIAWIGRFFDVRSSDRYGPCFY